MSAKFEQVRNFYVMGVWNKIHVQNAVVKNWITPEEFKLITGEDYKAA